jgi:hypothetical protein
MRFMKIIAAHIILILTISVAGCGSGGGGVGGGVSSNLTAVIPTYSVTGTITDRDTSLPVSGATVTIDTSSASTITTTNASGVFTIAGLAKGTYLVTPSMPGRIFQSPSKTVTVDAADVSGVDFASSNHGGQVLGLVADTGGQPLSPVTINVYSGTTLVSTVSNDVFGSYSLLLPAGTYRLEFSKNNFKTVAYNNLVVEDNKSSFLEMIFMIHNSFNVGPNSEVLLGDVSGRISNAINGFGVSGLTVHLREGLNNTIGPVIATTTTFNDGFLSDPKSDGFYTFVDPVTGRLTLPGGNYTAEVSGAGFTSVFFSVKCLGGRGTDNQNMTVAPDAAVGLVRIVLTWGTKRDLDSQLTGPTDAPPTRFHVYYINKTYSDTVTTASLDVDNTVAFGPETVTIPVHAAGVYRYSVHDFSGKAQTSSFALSLSGAQVRVYNGSTLVNTFNVPPGRGGTLWTVFEMDGDSLAITPVNRMTYKADETTIP